MVRDVEADAGGIAVFVNGAIGGMQSPLNIKLDDPKTGRPAPAASFRFAEVVGEYVARHAIDVAAKGRAVSPSGMEYREQVIEIPVSNQAYLTGSQAVDAFSLLVSGTGSGAGAAVSR
jgi:hypothetical protein